MHGARDRERRRTAITKDAYGAPRCESDSEAERVRTNAEYHWACWPYFSAACDGGV